MHEKTGPQATGELPPWVSPSSASSAKSISLARIYFNFRFSFRWARLKIFSSDLVCRTPSELSSNAYDSRSEKKIPNSVGSKDTALDDVYIPQ